MQISIICFKIYPKSNLPNYLFSVDIINFRNKSIILVIKEYLNRKQDYNFVTLSTEYKDLSKDHNKNTI